MDPAVEQLMSLLACPADRSPLERGPAELVCPLCRQGYPVDADGIVSFLPVAAAEVLAAAAAWDEESEDYAASFNAYTEAVEVPATVGRLGRPDGPVLDHGAGTGRMTAALHRATGRPVVALDFSQENLRRLLARCRGLPVLAVHADVRHLPLRDGVVGGVCSAGVHPLLRAPDRQRMLAELVRVLAPGAPLVLSTLNYSWVFRLWRLRGNRGAREGEHLHGHDLYYRRTIPAELRAELADQFVVSELVGIRNLPGRSLAAAARRVAGARSGARLAAQIDRLGPRADRMIERLAVSRLTGFLLLVRAERR